MAQFLTFRDHVPHLKGDAVRFQVRVESVLAVAHIHNQVVACRAARFRKTGDWRTRNRFPDRIAWEAVLSVMIDTKEYTRKLISLCRYSYEST